MNLVPTLGPAAGLLSGSGATPSETSLQAIARESTLIVDGVVESLRDLSPSELAFLAAEVGSCLDRRHVRLATVRIHEVLAGKLESEFAYVTADPVCGGDSTHLEEKDRALFCLSRGARLQGIDTHVATLGRGILLMREDKASPGQRLVVADESVRVPADALVSKEGRLQMLSWPHTKALLMERKDRTPGQSAPRWPCSRRQIGMPLHPGTGRVASIALVAFEPVRVTGGPSGLSVLLAIWPDGAALQSEPTDSEPHRFLARQVDPSRLEAVCHTIASTLGTATDRAWSGPGSGYKAIRVAYRGVVLEMALDESSPWEQDIRQRWDAALAELGAFVELGKLVGDTTGRLSTCLTH